MQSSTYLPFHIPFLPSLSNYLKPDGLIQLTVQAFLDFLPLAKKIDLFSSFARMKNDHPISPTNEVLLFPPSSRPSTRYGNLMGDFDSNVSLEHACFVNGHKLPSTPRTISRLR